MKKFFVLLKKEIKELITIQMVLPLVIMVVIFGFIGNIISKETQKLTSPQTIIILNQDTQESGNKIVQTLKTAGFQTNLLENSTIDNAKNIAAKQSLPAFLIIPQGFESNINNFIPQQIAVYKIMGNFSLLASAKYTAMDQATAILNNFYSNQWTVEKNVGIAPDTLKNPVKTSEFVIVGSKQANISLAALTNYINQQIAFIPIIFFIVIIFAAQMVATSVASEKENKTFEILLSSPVNRKTIILAKLIAGGIVALLFAGVYMVGMNFYFQGLTSGMPATGQTVADAASSLGLVFTPLGYLFLGASLFMGILVALSVSIVLGIMAESVKSVQAVITPLMILVILPYFLVMFLDINTISPVLRWIIYLIPFSHAFLVPQNLFLGNYPAIIYGIIYQFIVFMVFVIIATRIFSSDKIITLKIDFRKKRK